MRVNRWIALLFPLLLPASASADYREPGKTVSPNGMALEWRKYDGDPPARAEAPTPTEHADLLESFRQAWAGHYRQATTRGFGFVSGAIVCPGVNVMAAFRTAGMLSEQLGEANVTASLPAKTRAFIEVYGDPEQSREPNLEAYGCVLIPPGHRVLVFTAVLVPWVAAEVDGRVVVGATLSPMIGR